MHWELQQVETQMSESQEVPTGPLLVTTTVGIGSTWLSSRIHEFLILYPEIQIEIKLNDAELDLAMREADVAIRLHRPNQSEMIQRKLFTVHNHFYASQTYLARVRSSRQAVEDLDQSSRHQPSASRSRPILGDINYLERLGRAGFQRRAVPAHEGQCDLRHDAGLPAPASASPCCPTTSPRTKAR